MQGWKIFTHSVRMVIGNLGPALRISGLLYFAYMVVNAYFILNFGEAILVLQHNMAKGYMPATLPRGLVFSLFLNMFVGLLSSLWISVLWHRYVLLEESPATIIPPLNGPRLVSYFGKTVQLALMLIVFGVVIGMIVGMATGLLIGAAAAYFVPLFVLGILLFLSYRLGLVLPAAALNEPMAFTASWEKTKPAAGAIAQLAAIAVIFAVVIQIPSNMNPDPNSIVNLVYSYVMGWIAMMVGVSVLTTLYGIYAQGREL